MSGQNGALHDSPRGIFQGQAQHSNMSPSIPSIHGISPSLLAQLNANMPQEQGALAALANLTHVDLNSFRNSGGTTFNSPNEIYVPNQENLNHENSSDFEYDTDSEQYDDTDVATSSEQETEAVVSNNSRQTSLATYPPTALSILQNLPPNESAVNKPSQLSAQPNNYGNSTLVGLSAMSQLSAFAHQTVQSNPPSTVNMTSQLGTLLQGQAAHVNQGYRNNGYNFNAAQYQSGNDNDDGGKMIGFQNNKKYEKPESSTPIRPRNKMTRSHLGVDLYQMQRRAIAESMQSESINSSAVTSPLKRQKESRLSFFKIFQRNKHQSGPTGTSALKPLPGLNNSVNLPCLTEPVRDLDGENQPPKSETPEALPLNRASISMNDEKSSQSTTAEKDTLPFLYFTSNFPDTLLSIRLLKLSVEEVQAIISQIEHFQNVQDHLIATLEKESLSGAALMSCDLSDLKKVLDLNLGNWTMFEQLINGLRHIQNDELLKSAKDEQNSN